MKQSRFIVPNHTCRADTTTYYIFLANAFLVMAMKEMLINTYTFTYIQNLSTDFTRPISRVESDATCQSQIYDCIATVSLCKAFQDMSS